MMVNRGREQLRSRMRAMELALEVAKHNTYLGERVSVTALCRDAEIFAQYLLHGEQVTP